MLGIVFFICNLMTLLIIQAANMGLEKNRKNKRFGINLPAERMDDERVMEVVAKYRQQNRLWFWLSFIFLFPNFIKTPYFSFIFSLFIIWNTAMIIGKFGIITSASKSLRRLKETYGWFDAVRDADEKHWYFNMFYYNRDSQKLWVNDPSGYGSTVNIATKNGKIIMFVTALILFGTLIPAWVLIVIDDFVPPRIELTTDSLVIHSAFNKSAIAYDQIAEVTLIGELSGGTKVNGSSTELYRRGLFYYSAYGRCELSVYNEVTPIVVIIPVNTDTSSTTKAKPIKPVLFNAQTEKETLDLYYELLTKLDKLN